MKAKNVSPGKVKFLITFIVFFLLLSMAGSASATNSTWRFISIPNLPSRTGLVSLWTDRPGNLYVLANRTIVWPTNTESFIYHWDGVTWKQVYHLTDHQGNCIFGTGPSDIFVSAAKYVSEDWRPKMYHYDGFTWTEQPLPITDSAIQYIAGEPGNVYAHTHNRILNYDGVSWTIDFVGSGEAFGLVYISSNEIYAPRCWGHNLWNGSSWDYYDQGWDFCDLWAGAWGMRDNLGNLHMYTAGCNGWTNGVRVWRFTETPPPGSMVGSWGPVLSAGGSPGKADGLWGSGPNDVYAVGHQNGWDNGCVYHYNGTSWQQITVFGGIPAAGRVFGSGPDDVWITLGDGRLLHYSLSTIHVATTGDDNAGDGSEARPYRTIRRGIDAAWDGNTVLVEDGVYTGPGNVNLDFHGKAITVKSRNGAANCIIDCENQENTCGFYFHNGESEYSKVEGFTIKRGLTSFTTFDLIGGGIWCDSSSPTITNNKITENYGMYAGGGIHCVGSSAPVITNNEITKNSNASNGGGIYCGGSSAPTIEENEITENFGMVGGGICCRDSSNPKIKRNTISKNNGFEWGGGIACYSSATITDNIITENWVAYGGGIWCASSTVTIENNEIRLNRATVGGGIYCENSSPTIIRNNISGNKAGHIGGGICLVSSSPMIASNLIAGNESTEEVVEPGTGGGGGIYCRGSSPTLINNTITGNKAPFKGGGIFCESSAPIIRNSILWGNSPQEIFYDTPGDPNTIPVLYSNIQGGWPGEGNIDRDPLFVDAAGGDYHLSDSSPCIGAGIMTPDVPVADMDGHPRPDPPGSNPDMGAYENSHGERTVPWVIHVATTGDDTTGNGSIANPYRTIQKGIDVAQQGDTVLVADGVYGPDDYMIDAISFNGKAITVKSENGPANCIISGYEYYEYGFCFQNGEGPDSVLEGFTIQNNGAYSGPIYSCGVFCNNSSPTITNNVITENGRNGYWGSGIYCLDSFATIVNNIIIRNGGDEFGGGIVCEGSSPKIINSTIVENSRHGAYEGGGIYCRENSSPTVTNTIIWNNNEYQIFLGDGATIDITYSDIQGGWPGEGNIDRDPLFVDAAGGNYHLSDYSPCISSGIMTPDVPAKDIKGNPRPNPPGSNPDMGAYENSRSQPLPPAITLTSPNGGEILRGGTSHDIILSMSGFGIFELNNICLMYSTNGGGTYPNIITTVNPDYSTYNTYNWINTYQWTVPALNSGTVRVRATAADVFGNELAMDASDGNFIIDITAPETSVAGLAGTQGKNNWWISDVKVTLFASDNLARVKETKYRINDGDWQTYSEPFTVTGSNLYYKSEDNAGNQEAEKSQEIKVDKTPPATPVVTDDGVYTTNVSQLHAFWASSDTESGICKYEYAIGTAPGGNDVVNWTSAGIDTEVIRTGLNLLHGQTYYISVKAENCAGLWSKPGASDGIAVTTGNEPLLSVNPIFLDFGNSTNALSFNIVNAGVGSLNWEIAGTPPEWITSINPISGTNDKAVTVTVSRSGKNFGSYYYIIAISSNGGNKNIEVSMFVSDPAGLPMSIPATSGPRGASIVIPVRMGDTTGWGVLSAEFKLEYDASILTAANVTMTGSIARAWGAPTYNITPGRIIIAMAGITPLSGSGDLVNINFNVSNITSAGTISDIKFVDVILNEGAIPVNLQNGTFMVEISGEYYGDVSGNGTISAYDASLVLQYVAKLIDLTPQQRILADVTGNGTVSSLDASYILQYVAGLISSFPVETGSLANLSIASAPTVEVSIPYVTGEAGANITVPIKIKDTTGLGILGVEITLDYNPDVLTATGAIIEGTIASGWSLVHNISDGRITIIMAGSMALSGAGTFVKVIFTVSEDANIGATSPLEFSRLIFNEGSPIATVADGMFTVAPEEVEKVLVLNPGWSFISLPINKCFYQGTPPADQSGCVEMVDISDLGFETLADWFSSVMQPNDAWQMVIGPNGAMDRTLPAIFHSLKYISPASGYWLRIKEGVGTARLSLTGRLFDLRCEIPLGEGWNSVGCPLEVGYYDTASPPSGVHVPEGTTWVKVDPPVAAYVFGSIADKYDFIIGENGAYDPDLPPAFSSLHYVAPGYGVWINMNRAASLRYPSED